MTSIAFSLAHIQFIYFFKITLKINKILPLISSISSIYIDSYLVKYNSPFSAPKNIISSFSNNNIVDKIGFLEITSYLPFVEPMFFGIAFL